MPKVQGDYRHSLSPEKAVEKTKYAVLTLLESFEATDIEIVNDKPYAISFNCHSRGFSIKGTAEINADSVSVVVELPMVAIAFKGLIKAAIDRRIPEDLQ